jgi:hypothetical protein
MTMPLATIVPESLAWNSLTMNADNWGLLLVRYGYEVRRVPIFSGADELPRQIFRPQRILVIRATVLDLYSVPVVGTSSSMTVSLKGRSSSRTRTFTAAEFENIEGSQAVADPGAVDLVWACTASDGVTPPLS